MASEEYRTENAVPSANPKNDLRERAEEIARKRSTLSPDRLEDLSPEEARRTLHELQVHQIELEMQNEELRRTQEQLEASRARYFDLYDLAPIGYCTVSKAGLILEANLTAATLLGVARGVLVKQPLSRFILEEAQDVYYLHRKQVFATGDPQECELRMVHADGTVFWAHLATCAVPDTDGVSTKCRVVMSDITQRKLAEEEKARLEDQLRQAQRLESVGQLAGGVAHDFNNMLGVILGYAEMAIEQLNPAQPLHAELLEIRNAARRSSDLTRQLLAFSCRQPIMPEVLDLNETVAGMLKMLRRLIGENIELDWRPQEDLWPVEVDRSQFDQILANLCINARDAIAEVGKITIETSNSILDADDCTAHPGFNPGEYVRLVVSDSGCGMDKETLAHIFEPFFTTKEVGKGTGLGLATVYGALKQNNGFISVSSAPGEKTAFTIYLPKYLGEVEQAPTKGMPGMLKHNQETILLVDDEPTIQRLTAIMLEKQGYTVMSASTPDEATRLVREHADEIDLLLTDVSMAGMNGRDLARNLLSLCPHLKFLFMSGYMADATPHLGLLDEGVHSIQKPFSTRDLTGKVRKVLDSD